MNDRKFFNDSVIELPDQPGAVLHGMKINARDMTHENEELTISFSLMPDPAAEKELEARVAKGDVVSPDELKSKYGVGKDKVDPLVTWLKSEGFEIVDISPDGTGVYARATVAQIERSLHVDMIRVTKGGLTWTAARNAPSLPANVAASVNAIGGLQPFRHAHKHLRRTTPMNRRDGNGSPATARETQPTTQIANAPPYLVSEMLKAYDADGLQLTGEGQAIAILIDTFPSDSDLQAFWTRNGIDASLDQIKKINVGSGPLPPAEGEETLDAEWSSGVAPKADIRIYASGSLQFSDLNRALDRILSDLSTVPGMRQLSISLGLGEKFMSAGEVRTQHSRYLRLAAAGVNVFVSSGDAGSNPDSTGHGAEGPLQAEYPASDSCVIGVGGTSLKLAANGSVRAEPAWPDSGGGKSIFFKRPAWQKGKGMPSGTARCVPDVSLAADPMAGAFVVLNGQVEQIGGTSWSAPMWAGICALINEARIKAGKPALKFLGPLIYPLLGKACFRDIVTGGNGAFEAGPGYDMVTGIGVPSVKVMINQLSQ